MIEVENVSKTYRALVSGRRVHAVRDLSLTIAPGEVLGIAGPNGAGKTTLLALLLGFLRPTAGSIRLHGEAPRHYVERAGVAYLSELVNVPAWWTVTGALRRYAVLSGVARDRRELAVQEAIERLGLGEHRSKRIKQLSKGNLQRLGLVQALLIDASIVILDEPTHGLDPVWTQRFRDIVEALRRPDRIIVIASHNLDELERLADRVAILDRGALSRIADARDSHVGGTADYRLVLAAEHPALAEVFPNAKRVPHAREVAYDLQGSLDELNAGLQRLLEANAVVWAFYPARSRLEETFREAVGAT